MLVEKRQLVIGQAKERFAPHPVEMKEVVQHREQVRLGLLREVVHAHTISLPFVRQ